MRYRKFSAMQAQVIAILLRNRVALYRRRFRLGTSTNRTALLTLAVGTNSPREVGRLVGCLGARVDVGPLLQFRKRQTRRLQPPLFVQVLRHVTAGQDLPAQ